MSTSANESTGGRLPSSGWGAVANEASVHESSPASPKTPVSSLTAAKGAPLAASNCQRG